MFCSRALRIAYDDYLSDFEELLVKDNTVTIHKPNLRKLAIEMYKISNNLSPLFTREIMTEICVPYNTRSQLRLRKITVVIFNALKDPTMRSQVPKRFLMV